MDPKINNLALLQVIMIAERTTEISGTKTWGYSDEGQVL